MIMIEMIVDIVLETEMTPAFLLIIVVVTYDDGDGGGDADYDPHVR
jgi:hypothetical protein